MPAVRPRAAHLLAGLLGLLHLGVCWAAGAGPVFGDTLSGLAIVLSQDFTGEDPQTLLAIHTAEGERVQVLVDDPLQLEGLATGMPVQLQGSWEAEPLLPDDSGEPLETGDSAGGAQAAAVGKRPVRRTRFRAAAIRRGKGKGRYATAASVAASTGVGGSGTAAAAAAVPIGSAAQPGAITLSANPLVSAELSTIVIPLTGATAAGGTCPGTEGPPRTVDQIRAILQPNASSDPMFTVGGMYQTCSYGKTLISANSTVADVVKLPCSGGPSQQPWALSKCDMQDFFGWADAADDVLRARGVPLEQYRHKVYLVPPGPCAFVGLGYLGCVGGGFECRVWLGGGFWAEAMAMVHELGHNLHLAHASRLNADGTLDEYGDDSCAMGFCCGPRCFNTPHAWQLGWIGVQEIDSVDPGQTVAANLTSQALSQRSGMRVVPGWTTGADPLFLGYRTAARADAPLSQEYAGKVSVWTSTINGTYDMEGTILRASLHVGDAWDYPAANLTVRVTAAANGVAGVTVCRSGGAETLSSCTAGVDSDCNGLAGSSDPACLPILGIAPVLGGGPLLGSSQPRRPSPPPRIRRPPRKLLPNFRA